MMAKGAVIKFLKTTVVGGVVFLVPVVVLGIVVVKVAAVLRRLAQPLAPRLPIDTLAGVVVADVVVIVLLILGCFVAGLLARVSFAKRFVKKAEAGVLWRIPGYGFLKGLTDSLDESEAASSMRPVMVRFDDYQQLAFQVDQLPDGRKVIYIPSAPDPRAGAVLVLAADRVELLPMSFVAAIGAIRKLGRDVGPALTAPTH
jgi:uncharacterized membrane protein